MKRFFSLVVSCLLIFSTTASAQQPSVSTNLLLNPDFAFHSFDNSRRGTAAAFRSGAVPCWDQEAYGDAEVVRGPRAPFRSRFPVDGVVVIHPGKRFSQFALLTEVGLDHGDRVSLSVFGNQAAPDALQAEVQLMRADSASGEWQPSNFGQEDKRTFPRHARGELIAAPGGAAKSGAATDFELKVENLPIVGAFTESADISTDQPNTVGLTVEFTNVSDKDVWIYAPCLSKSSSAQSQLPAARELSTLYRSIPRTMQKLWRGEPLHIMVMGSSIDRGSANPPLYLYDENPASPTFKQPISQGAGFDGNLVGHPEWNDYVGQWRHHFMYGGRLRRALMRKFDYPINKLLLNTMATDGSSISEAHSGLADYASLSIPPNPELNGHKSGKTWRELYPDVFARPEGARPDLVIFGSGANEKVDGADEIVLFEGAIRWFQRHYPDTEFVFCMWQNRESYTPNTGHLMELALRYQIPYVDFGRVQALATRHTNNFALTPKDGHPQAAAHYMWSKQLERAFDAADPIESGVAQLQLPERAHRQTVGWEGDISTYGIMHPRIRSGNAFILDDTMLNLWASSKDEVVGVRVDGQPPTGNRRRPFNTRELRNSTFATGKLALGERHIVEVTGTDAKLVAVDSKIVPNRQWIGVDSKRWQLGAVKREVFASEWGAPYGAFKVLVGTGQSIELDAVGTDFSVAYVDQSNGGTLQATVDGIEQLKVPANVPFTDTAGQKLWMENRKGILNLAYGVHHLKITAVGGPVTLLGVFSYDTRANRSRERVLRGLATPGDAIQFSPAFATRPLVFASGGLQVVPKDVTPGAVTFSGKGPGAYEVVGQ